MLKTKTKKLTSIYLELGRVLNPGKLKIFLMSYLSLDSGCSPSSSSGSLTSTPLKINAWINYIQNDMHGI